MPAGFAGRFGDEATVPEAFGTLEKVILQSPKGLSATVLKRVDMVAFRLQTYEV